MSAPSPAFASYADDQYAVNELVLPPGAEGLPPEGWRKSMSDLHEIPGHLFRRVHQISSAVFAEGCGASGPTSVQFAALTAIGEQPGVDATRLSSLIAFDRSTLSDVLERLETRGWVVRHPSPCDKRIKPLRLSQAGSHILAEVEPAVRRVQQRLLAPVSAQERAKMVTLLVRLVEAHSGDLTGAPAAANGAVAEDDVA